LWVTVGGNLTMFTCIQLIAFLLRRGRQASEEGNGRLRGDNGAMRV
jgi:hypothetical protein